MAKKLDSSYYKIAKKIIKSIADVSTSEMAEISSATAKKYFDEDKVGITLEPRVRNFYKNLEKMKAAQDKIKARFNGCDIQVDGNIFISIPKEEIEALDEFKELTAKPEHDIISFWATTVFEYRDTAVAYGAKIKTVDGFEFPKLSDVKRIQKSLGEKRFYEFCLGETKSFKSYSALVNFITSIDRYAADRIPSEQDLIDSAKDERYYTH